MLHTSRRWDTVTFSPGPYKNYHNSHRKKIFFPPACHEKLSPFNDQSKGPLLLLVTLGQSRKKRKKKKEARRPDDWHSFDYCYYGSLKIIQSRTLACAPARSLWFLHGTPRIHIFLFPPSCSFVQLCFVYIYIKPLFIFL